MLLSIVTVGYFSREPLLEGFRGLLPQIADLAAEVVVVDNASTDGTLEALAREFPAVRRIANSDNVGYARAINQGIAATTGEFVVVMNPDCVVRPGAIPVLIEHLRAHPRTAMAGPKLINTDGTLELSARRFPDHFTFLFNRYSLLTRLFPNNPYSRRYLMSDWDHASQRDVDWLSGAFLMVRRAAIDQVGGMDEAFFMFNEDVDWCRCMRLAGWNVTYVPEAVVVHHMGASRSRVSTRVVVERHRGMIHYFHKHHPTNPILRYVTDGAILSRAALMLAVNALRRS
jgi:GT2 family glycosyltransferase